MNLVGQSTSGPSVCSFLCSLSLFLSFNIKSAVFYIWFMLKSFFFYVSQCFLHLDDADGIGGPL